MEKKLPLKKGAGRIYEALNLPCKVALNTGKVWPKNSFFQKSFDIHIKFLEPINPGMSREFFVKELETKNLYCN